MASWLEWLGSLLSDLWAPRPGTHEARLRAKKLGALLSKEANKPPEQQDAELIRSLNVSYRRAQLQNEQAMDVTYLERMLEWEEPAEHDKCCAAAGWVRQRMAASYRARRAYVGQRIQQLTEELAAAEARRPALLVAQPTLRLDLPEALQHPPPRIDMCSACASKVEQAERHELSLTLQGEDLRRRYQLRGLQPAAAAAGPRAAEVPPTGEASQGQQRQQCGASNDGREEEPSTPVQQQQQQQQQQHASSEEDQEQRN